MQVYPIRAKKNDSLNPQNVEIEAESNDGGSIK